MYCYVLCHKNTHNSDHCCLVWCGCCAESVVRALCCDAPLFTGSIDHTSYCIKALYWQTRGVHVCSLLYIQSSCCPTGRYWSLAILSVISQVVRSPRCYCRSVFRAIKLIKSHIWRLRRWVILQQWRWRPGVGAGVNLSRGGGNWRQG